MVDEDGPPLLPSSSPAVVEIPVKVSYDSPADLKSIAQMIQAVDSGDATAVQDLIARGVDPTKIVKFDQPLLNSATTPAIAEALLAHGVSFDPKTDGTSMLVHASWRNNLPMIL